MHIVSIISPNEEMAMLDAAVSRCETDEYDGGTLLTYLLSQYGPLMTLVDLAAVLRRNRKALGESLRTEPDAPWVKAILRARVPVGARDMFRTHDIAEFLQRDDCHEG